MTLSLQNQIKDCTKCGLCKFMPLKPVPGVGPIPAKFMIVGEAIDHDSAILEEPLSGQSGQLLTRMLDSAGLSREMCYITTVLKCSPTNNGVKYRTPRMREIKACQNWLFQEIKIVNPKVIFAMGKIPDLILNGTLNIVVKMFSPAYLLQRSKQEVNEAVEIFRRYKDA